MGIKDNFYYDNIIQRFKNGEIDVSEALGNYINKKNQAYTIKKTFDQKEEKTKIQLQENNDLKTEDLIVKKEDNNIINETNMKHLFKKMNSLIGLENVKKIIKEYIAYIKIQKIREIYGLKSSPIVMHMIFKGNPGTGKTTMARIIGEIFKELGIIKNDKILEIERADLVGEYIGHTAQKTKKIIEKAIGGILFVDEAYSLARGGEKDFGKEAIDTMVKAMEDNKDNLIIILAGYRKEMDAFLKTNPGLSSRFALHIDFPDYDIDDLVKIAEMMYKEREYILTKDSKHYIYNVISKLRYKENINGNARTVRNLVEQSIRKQAKRIINKNVIKKEQLIYITKEDLIQEE
ncbi:AAA family ATPase [Natronospora cellulosivora (SeqCode)]